MYYFYMKNATYYRNKIAEGIKKLRHERRLTQGEFARLLNLSQSQFSKIENAQGLIAAEQFLFVLQHFNLSLDYFLKIENQEEEILALQNALIRFGAKHLSENSNVIVPDKYRHLNQILFECLSLYPSARLVTSLAPVIVRHFNQINCYYWWIWINWPGYRS